MNAHDSSSAPGPQTVSEDARAQLREAILSLYRNEGGAEPKLRDALHRAAAEAHESGLRPEGLVIAMKALLDDLPESPHGLSAADQLKVRDRIVSACIKAYFGHD